MSMSNLSVDGEFRYIVQWFNEWSELQRDDFVYILVEYLTKDAAVGAGGDAGNGEIYLNGVVNNLATAASVQDKPMSLFQCRIKLFREWSPKWPVEFKCKLREKIHELDAKVGEKIINELKGTNAEHNGDVALHLNENGAVGDDEVEQATVAEEEEAAAIVDESAETVNDNHLAAVLRQETPVDDDDEEGGGGGEVLVAGADLNGHYASSASAAVTTIAVNTSPEPQPEPQPEPATGDDEPVEQVENNVTASVIVAVPAATATAATATSQAEVPPVA